MLETDKDPYGDLEATFDLNLSTIPEKHEADRFIPLLKRDATYMAVGALAEFVGYDSQDLIIGHTKLWGSLIGSLAETQEILDFCAEHGIATDEQVIPIQEIGSL